MNEWVDPDVDKNFRTVIPPALWKEYYEGLGQLMHYFARLENTLNVVVARFLEKHVHDRRLEDRSHPAGGNLGSQRSAFLNVKRTAVIRAALGGMRSKTLRDTLNRLLRVTGTRDDFVTEIEHIFAHIADIQFFRDRIAHNSAVPDMTNKEGWFYTSNHFTTAEEVNWENIYFKPSMLLDMAVDLEAIPDMISAFTESPKDDLPPRRPWRYIPSSLRRDRPRSTTSKTTRKRQPRSSRR